MSKVLELYESEKYGVIELQGDTTIVCHGNVIAERILCKKSMHLNITGDSLTVNFNEHGIAIGADAEWGLSGGRFYLPDIKVTFNISVNEIHCSSKTEGCGIGVYGVYAIKSSDFTSDCILQDTPVDMIIYNEPLQGSTKHSVLPRYMTVAENGLREANIKFELSKKLQFEKAIQPLVNLFSQELSAIASLSDDRKEKDIATYEAVKKFLNRLNKDTYAEGVQRIFISFVKALYNEDCFQPSQYRHIAGNMAYLCLARELILFEKVAVLPLAFRYYLIAYDLTDNDRLEKNNISNMSSFYELSLDDELISWYNHPKNISYDEECKRFFLGENIYATDDRDTLNSLCVPKISIKDNIFESETIRLIPRLRWGFSGVDINYKGLGDNVGIITFDSANKLKVEVVPKENYGSVGNNVILCGYTEVVSDIVAQLKMSIHSRAMDN